MIADRTTGAKCWFNIEQRMETYMKMGSLSILSGAVALATVLSLTAAPVRAQGSEGP
jgi:hypothetical protein